jgi:hypothetical protein
MAEQFKITTKSGNTYYRCGARDAAEFIGCSVHTFRHWFSVRKLDVHEWKGFKIEKNPNIINGVEVTIIETI